MATSLWFNPRQRCSPGTISVFFYEKSQMANVPNDIETLPKILIAWVGCTNVTDDRRAGDDIIIANVNVSSRSLKWTGNCSFESRCRTDIWWKKWDGCKRSEHSVQSCSVQCWAVPRYYLRGTAVLLFHGTSTVEVTVLPWYRNTINTAVLPYGTCQ